MSLHNLLVNRRAIKLVCGAGNEDAAYVNKLVDVYARAGVRYFDVSANLDVVRAAKEALRRLNITGYINVSVGIAGDPHMGKAIINEFDCINCGRCDETCHQHAIDGYSQLFRKVIPKNCIGCGACEKVCPTHAIQIRSFPTDLDAVLPPLLAEGIDSLELHVAGASESEALWKWGKLVKTEIPILSLCIDRHLRGDKEMIDLLKMILAVRANQQSVIVQADGIPMSGAGHTPATTLQALATAQIVQNAGIGDFLMLSGGTNRHTAEYARTFGLSAHGVALGTYARKLMDDTNWDEAIARDLVGATLWGLKGTWYEDT